MTSKEIMPSKQLPSKEMASNEIEKIPFSHLPVMPEECIKGLNVKLAGTYIDCTVGGGGHAELISRIIGDSGTLLGLDRDEAAIKAAGERLPGKILLVNTNFDKIDTVCEELAIKGADGILMDLGVSSYQLDEAKRGFSYTFDAPLDMRMDSSSYLTAYKVVNEWSKKELETIIYTYGEERWGSRIAQFICEARSIKPIITTGQLADIILKAVPAAARRKGHHPAKRTFQAIRIAVNDELGSLERALVKCITLLNTDGRLCAITFHSLEDRIVKRAFEKALNRCTCPKYIPVCVCGKGKPIIENITRKPILPTPDEIERNPRSRSAKLRIARKVT